MAWEFLKRGKHYRVWRPEKAGIKEFTEEEIQTALTGLRSTDSSHEDQAQQLPARIDSPMVNKMSDLAPVLARGDSAAQAAKEGEMARDRGKAWGVLVGILILAGVGYWVYQSSGGSKAPTVAMVAKSDLDKAQKDLDKAKADLNAASTKGADLEKQVGAKQKEVADLSGQLAKQGEQAALKDKEIDKLKGRVSALNQELTQTKLALARSAPPRASSLQPPAANDSEKLRSQLAARDELLAGKDREIERLKRELAAKPVTVAAPPAPAPEVTAVSQAPSPALPTSARADRRGDIVVVGVKEGGQPVAGKYVNFYSFAGDRMVEDIKLPTIAAKDGTYAAYVVDDPAITRVEAHPDRQDLQRVAFPAMKAFFFRRGRDFPTAKGGPTGNFFELR